MISTTSYHFIESNYHDSYKCAHISLFNNQFGNSGYSLLDKCYQWMFFLCGKRSFDLRCLSTGWFFFMVGKTTDRVFRADYTISFFVSLALSLFDFLCLLLIIFKYLVYLLFFIKCFFSTQDCAFPVSRGLVDYARCGPGVMFIDVTS